MATHTETHKARASYEAPHTASGVAAQIRPGDDLRAMRINHVSWGGIFAGVVVALITTLVLNMLGIGIGAATIDPAQAGGTPSFTGFSVGAGLWWIVSGIIAAFAGGYAASRLSGIPSKSTGAWNGLVAWALSMVVVIYLMGSALGTIMGGMYSAVANTAGGIASIASTAAPTIMQEADPMAALQNQIDQAVGGANTEEIRTAIVNVLTATVQGDQQAIDQAETQAAQVISEARGIPVPQARDQLQQWTQQFRQGFEQAQQQAAQVADTAANAVAQAAFWGAVALILGALAAWFGGRVGAVKPDMPESHAVREEQDRALH
ncbi:MAG: PhnA-like protein [Alphaproteobacteria bacterium]|nr:PhnA-like protein [Alphaproteobacteria bacterium]